MDIRIVSRKVFVEKHTIKLLEVLDSIDTFKHGSDLRIPTATRINNALPEIQVFNRLLQVLRSRGEGIILVTQ